MNARTKSFLLANATICRTAVRYLSDLNCATQPGLVGGLNLAQCQSAQAHAPFLCTQPWSNLPAVPVFTADLKQKATTSLFM